MSKELRKDNKQLKSEPIFDKDGNKIGEKKSVYKEDAGHKKYHSESHASKKTEDGEFEMYSSETVETFEGE